MKILSKALVATMTVALIGSLASCSGGSKGESILFGELPGIMMQVSEKQQEIKKEAETITTQEQKSELLKKEQKMKEKWTPKIEEAAKALDGKPIEIEPGDFTITTPLSLTYDSMSKNSLAPYFKITGEAKITKEISGTAFAKVAIAGYDAEGAELFKAHVGYMEGDYSSTGKSIPAQTPVKLNSINYRTDLSEAYIQAKTLKLIIE